MSPSDLFVRRRLRALFDRMIELDEAALRLDVETTTALLGRPLRLAVLAEDGEADDAVARAWGEVAESVGMEVALQGWPAGSDVGAERVAALQDLPDSVPDQESVARELTARGLAAVKKFRALHGHDEVPRGYREQETGFSLGQWVHEQRVAPVRRLLTSLAEQVDGVACAPGARSRLIGMGISELVPSELDVAAAGPAWVGRLAMGLPVLLPPMSVAVLRLAVGQDVRLHDERVLVVSGDDEFAAAMSCVLRAVGAVVTTCRPGQFRLLVDSEVFRFSELAMAVWHTAVPVPPALESEAVVIEASDEVGGISRLVAEVVVANTVLAAQSRGQGVRA